MYKIFDVQSNVHAMVKGSVADSFVIFSKAILLLLYVKMWGNSRVGKSSSGLVKFVKADKRLEYLVGQKTCRKITEWCES